MDGIELSQDMVDRMREEPGGTTIDVTIGDMSRACTGRSYGLVYLVYNTIGNLLTQDDQVRCFQTPPATSPGTACSSPNAGYPPPPRAQAASSSTPEHIAADHVVLGVCQYDPVTQILDRVRLVWRDWLTCGVDGWAAAATCCLLLLRAGARRRA